MGTFLSLSAVWGKTLNEVADGLERYAASKGGGLREASGNDADQHCIINHQNGNTIVVYPEYYTLWDETSAFLSAELNTPVFFVHVHDGDLWMYELFVNGEIVDQFNTVPDYWDPEMSLEEKESWAGNAGEICRHFDHLTPAAIENYLKWWPVGGSNGSKAYPQDNAPMGDEFQFADFLDKLGFSYTYTAEGVPEGNWHTLFTQKLKPRIRIVEPALVQADPEPVELEPVHTQSVSEVQTKKPWWKFW